MNENLNLVEILKDCPKGTILYSATFGDVELVRVRKNEEDVFPIEVKRSDGMPASFTKNGEFYLEYSGECILFPSREQRDWSKFTAPWPKKERFDPKTLKPFDQVLVRDESKDRWCCDLFSHNIKDVTTYPYFVCSGAFEYCIPYNNDTRHLVGTNEEAPEYYRYWED